MNAPWWRVTIVADPGQSDAVIAALVAATGNGVEEPQAGLIRTVVDSEQEAEALLGGLCGRFHGVTGMIEATERVDWSTRWRDGIVTRSFGRLTLTPSWLPVAPRGDERVVVIDPESAFGSGEHGSTRGALALLERHVRSGHRVLDLGSGSGVIAIAAVKLGARSAVGVEIDAEALPVAEANAERNGVATATTFLLGDAAELAPLAGPADLICSNILRTVNVALFPAIGRSLAPAGTIIFAGMEEAEAGLFLPAMADNGLVAVDDVRDAGWWSVAARRR